MAQRRFGPTLGAGVVVIEKEAEKLAEPAPLGVTLYVTPLEKGDPAKLISTFSKKDMIRKVGGRIAESDGPDCAHDFWDASLGAGELHFLRVAASGLRKAELDVYSREQTNPPDDFSGSAVKQRAVMRVTAKSGGRWGSRKRVIWRLLAGTGDVGVTTLTTGLAMLQDEWKDGVVKLDAVPTKEYKITANTTAGVVSVSSDSDMDADYGASTDLGYQLVLDTRTGVEGLKRTVQVMLGDGENSPGTEFSLAVFVNEEQVRYYPDLSMDPTSKRYFVRMINDDQGNQDVEVTDLLTPSAPTPHDRRPANENGIVSAVTATTLTSKLIQVRRTVGDANPTFTLGATTDVMKYRDVYEFEVTADGASATISMKSMRVGNGTVVHAPVTASNTATTAFAFTSPTSPLTPPITITCGSTTFQVGDKFQVDYFPFEPDKLIGGYVVPDIVNKPNARFKIIDNDHKTITIQSGDMTTDGGGAANDRFVVFYPQELGGPDRIGGTATNGYDALAALADTDYTATQLNPGSSPARVLIGQNKGLVKVATPDRSSTNVAKQGLVFAEAFNWQYRVEIPDTVTTESAAVDHINTTIGRNDYGVTIFPSYADVADPERPGFLKRTPLTGMIHGREALVAKNFDGYHKAAAGVEVTLPKVVKLPFEPTLNEEVLNPQGINVIRFSRGNFIIWGDRTIALDSAWKFKHQRELMSHYENRLRDSFDFIVFALNDASTQARLLAALSAMFLPEFVKGAVRGDNFADAVKIKIDDENNTDATRAAGDLNADISLRLADTVERFVISIGKQGIFDSVSA
jgi:hypothetical protein